MIEMPARTESLPWRTVWRALGREGRNALRDAMRRLLATGRATAFAHLMERGGRMFRFAHHLHLARDSEGHVTGVAETVEDLEEASGARRASSHFDQLTRPANAPSFSHWWSPGLGEWREGREGTGGVR